MAQAIHGVSNFLKNITLSNYSLKTQLIIINIFTAVIGSIFLLLINYFLLSNNNNLNNQIEKVANQSNEITNFLSNNAVRKLAQFNLEKCELNSASINDDCAEKIYSEPKLDPTFTQKYLLENYLYSDYSVKIYDDSWIKFADTDDIFISEDVLEIDVKQNLYNLDIFISIEDSYIKDSVEKDNLYNQYKNNYFKFFNYLQRFYNNKYLSKIGIEKDKRDIFLVKETIKKNSNYSYLYNDDNKNTILVSSSPIVKNDNIYGVVIISSILNNENFENGLISLNLNNLFIIIIFIMFLFSFLFSQSIVSPINILSKILRSERDKSNKNTVKLNYPNRRDEIGVLSNDIKSMSEDLKNQINEIRGFAADVSHELKNPLASLKNSNEVLVDDKIPHNKKNLLLKNMQKDIERINILIDDISKYAVTGVEIEDELFTNFDINNFLEELLESYKDNEKNIRIILEFENKPINIYANKQKLAQVFINLIMNSFSICPKNSKILIKQKINKDNLTIYFVDQGPGISDNIKNKVFERFYTDREIKKDKHSGLGLSIAKKIIESFSGSIKLSDIKFQQYLGACFEINLPLKE